MTTMPTTSNINARQINTTIPKISSSNLLHISQKYRAPNKSRPFLVHPTISHGTSDIIVYSHPMGGALKGRYFVKRAGKGVRLVGAGVAGKKGGGPLGPIHLT